MRSVPALLGALLLVALAALPATAETAAPTPDPAPAPTAEPLGSAPLLLLLDASGSMNADDGTGRPKIEAAREALRAVIDELGPDVHVGLRAYGHRTPNTDREAGCADTELLVPVGPADPAALRAAVDGLQASGFTPIGRSLQAAVDDLPPEGRRTVVLVSDGIDTCAPPRACDVARQIVADGVELRVEAVGFQVDAATAEELRCIAEATGGTYRPADDAADLARELRAHIPTGTPVTGGPTPSEAVVIGPGQYVDTLPGNAARWYAVDLQAGDRVRATAALVGDADTPLVPAAEVDLTLEFADVLGITRCDHDEATGVGPFTVDLAVDGLQVEAGAVCTEPGRYLLGLRLTDPSTNSVRGSVLDGVEIPVELFVAVSRSAVTAPVAEPIADRPRVAEAPPVEPGRQPTPTSAYLAAVTVAGLLGLLGGAVVSRRLGP